MDKKQEKLLETLQEDDILFLKRLEMLFCGIPSESLQESARRNDLHKRFIALARVPVTILKPEKPSTIEDYHAILEDNTASEQLEKDMDNTKLLYNEDRPAKEDECFECAKHAQKECNFVKVDTRCKHWEQKPRTEYRKLIDENRKLKETLGNAKPLEDLSCTELFQETLVLIKENAGLRNENEQLKQEIEDFNDIIKIIKKQVDCK